MKISKPHNPYLLFVLLVLLEFCPISSTGARDPKVEEMPTIEEIAGYLRGTARELYSSTAYQLRGDSRFEKILGSLERLSEKADLFYDRTVKDSRAPWRSTSAYRELNWAFISAQNAFISRATYLLDPVAFADIAYLMGALLPYYQEPNYAYYSPSASYPQGGYAVYPRAVYPWLPSFFVYSNSRFANPQIYPWSRFVIFGTMGK